MNKLFQYINRTFSARITFWTIFFVSSLFVTALLVMYFYARKTLRDEAMMKASVSLMGTMQRIDNMLNEVEVMNQLLAWNIEHHLDNPDMQERYIRETLMKNTSIIGCCAAYKPDYYKEKGRLYMPYFYREDSRENAPIRRSDHYGTKDYVDQDWYVLARDADQPTWLRPVSVNSTAAYELVATYSIPMHDLEGNFVGVCSIDVSLDWFSKLILSDRPFPHSYYSLISHRGIFLIHPDMQKMSQSDGVTRLLDSEDSSVKEVLQSIIKGDSGVKEVFIYNKWYYVFFKPLKNIAWTTTLSCPKDDILHPSFSLMTDVVLILVAGILLLAFVCYEIVNRWLQPLQMLNSSVCQLANGDFGTKIPVSKHLDEIGLLQNCFRAMEESLSDYIHRLDQFSADLAERNEALQKAYEQTKETDRMKMAFLSIISDQMSVPVEAIAHIVGIIKENERQLESTEVAHLVDKVTEHTDRLGQMLNELLEQALNKDVKPTMIDEIQRV